MIQLVKTVTPHGHGIAELGGALADHGPPSFGSLPSTALSPYAGLISEGYDRLFHGL